jgi:hypothetical protein
MPCKSKKPGLSREVHLVTDVPLVIVMKYVGTHWTIARVVVDDENPDLDRKHIPAEDPSNDFTGLPKDNPAVIAAISALTDGTGWPAWDFGF